MEEVRRELPQYAVGHLIGRGGMGAVYQGRQDSLDRVVAIKILPPGIDCDDLQFAARFKQEAKAMAMFHHPGIVGVYDAGETPGGLLYLVMELIEGNDVADLLEAQGKLPPADAVRIAAKVCEALAYAHERGVIHRDIKPSNVMIERDGTVKVADFGLAKMHAQDGFTCSDMALGSPDFAAPECHAPGVAPDGRADVFSVGAMLYQMLTGKLPRGRFDLPSALVPGLDKRLDRIVDRALQTDLGKRYPGVIELRADLNPILTSAGAKPAGSKPMLVGLAAALVLSVVSLALWLPKLASISQPSAATGKSNVELAAAVRPQWQKIEFSALDPKVAVAGQVKQDMESGLLRLRDWARWRVPAGPGAGNFVTQRNVACRIVIPMNYAAMPMITFRIQWPMESQYVAVIYSERIALIRKTGKGKEQLQYIGNYPLTRVPAEGEMVTVQFACVGHHLMVWFEGRLLGQVDDNAFDQPGEFGIQARDSRFKSLEYLPLDSVSESEALKLIATP